MKLLNARPQFKGKPKSSPLDTCEPYLLLKQTIAAGQDEADGSARPGAY
jgi:hypothetical protein